MEIDECNLPDKGGCNDICKNTIGSYYCECQTGKLMFPNKKHCEDILDYCGGILNVSERIVIASSHFPEEYPENVMCEWDILNENVQLTFLYMDVQGSKKGCQDEVTISGHNVSDKMYCGWRTPESLILSSTSGIKIKFNSGERIKKWKKWIGFAISIVPS
ncbi:tolloid-like protein 1 [Centruroides vittatus]|uniref:tolloid-like protein 1 n=1 Tax=Centruroides vittatus TaxID=120091 RepID=UPI00350EB600